MTTAAVVPLINKNGAAAGVLEIACLPGRTEWSGTDLLVDLRGQMEGVETEAPVQLLEEAEYSYRAVVDGGAVIIEPTELFDSSQSDGREGRLRPGRSTGTVTASVIHPDGAPIGFCELEVRARKLDYLSEYRWMLQRIAEEAAEIVQSRFAASALSVFQPDETRSPETIYQRFAFIQSLLDSEEFNGSIQLILNRPHHTYEEVHREIDPSRGVRAGRGLARHLTAPGPRQSLPSGVEVARLTSIPRSMPYAEHSVTYDTIPNRFVKFALKQWRNLASDVEHAIAREQTPAARRGRREAHALGLKLELILAAGLFSDVGGIDVFPAANPTLQNRAGYRDLLLAFLQAEAAALVDWSGGETVFGAGQRDVSTLYEYWVFLELVRIVGSCDGFEVDRRPLFRVSASGLSLDLRRGCATVLQGRGIKRGRAVHLELWFNRKFSAGIESWTASMRPDCSLRITPAGAEPMTSTTWLHFDAKYRVQAYEEVLHDFTDDVAPPSQVTSAKTEDLLKMHAYRDAIRRTSGAFVLYPGRDTEPHRRSRYHEILPGLGAFVLRPKENGRSDETTSLALRRFIEDVIDHAASQGTDEQRAGYWSFKTYAEGRGLRLQTNARLRKPPADAQVLLGFVRNDHHLLWIQRTGLYNLRADNRRGAIGLDAPELASDMLCLYTLGADDLALFELPGAFVLQSADELRRSGYESPQGELYCCLVLGEPFDAEHMLGFTADGVRYLARQGRQRSLWAAPRVVSWSDLMLHPSV